MGRHKFVDKLEILSELRFRIPVDTDEKTLEFLNARLKVSRTLQGMFWQMVNDLMINESTKADIERLEKKIDKLM